MPPVRLTDAALRPGSPRSMNRCRRRAIRRLTLRDAPRRNRIPPHDDRTPAREYYERAAWGRGLLQSGVGLGPLPALVSADISPRLRRPHGRSAARGCDRAPARDPRSPRFEILPQYVPGRVERRGRPLCVARADSVCPLGFGRVAVDGLSAVGATVAVAMCAYWPAAIPLGVVLLSNGLFLPRPAKADSAGCRADGFAGRRQGRRDYATRQ